MTKFDEISRASRESLARYEKGRELTAQFAGGFLVQFQRHVGMDGDKGIWVNHPLKLNIRDNQPVVERLHFDGIHWNFGLSIICDEARPQQIAIRLKSVLKDRPKGWGTWGS